MFETSDPGEIIELDIDDFLWPMCAYESREEFLQILSRHNSHPTSTHFEDAVRCLRTILPGTDYLRRDLSPQAGRGGRAFLQGIFKQGVGQPFDPNVPKNKDTLCKDFVKTLTENREVTTNEDIIRFILESDVDTEDGAIFVFVTCGSIQKSLTSVDTELLEEFQRNKDLEFWRLGNGDCSSPYREYPVVMNQRVKKFTMLQVSWERKMRGGTRRWLKEVAALKRGGAQH